MQIYVHHAGQQQGPFSLELVRARLADGTFQASDLAWHEGATGWLPLSQVPALAGVVTPPPMMSPTGGYAPGQVAYAGQAPRTSGLAIASLILGLLSMLLAFFTALPAIICGHLALSEIKKTGGALTGRGMAITGWSSGISG